MALENVWFPFTNVFFFFVMVDLLQTGRESLLVETQFLLVTLVVLLSGIQLGSWIFGWGFGTQVGVSVIGAELPISLAPLKLFIPFGVTTWLAAYLASSATITGAWALAARRKITQKAFWLLAALLVVLTLFTDSRGGWVSLIAGTTSFVVLHVVGEVRFQKWVRRHLIPLMVVAAAVLAVAFFAIMHLSTELSHSAGDSLRIDLWRGAVEIADDHPFFGVGPGLFGRAYRLYRDPFYVDNRLGTAHNFYLNTLAETGVIGSAIAIGIAVLILLSWWRLWSHAETRSRKIHLEGALAALGGFGVQSLFDTFTIAPLVLLALFLTAYCVTETRSRIETWPKGNVLMAVTSLLIVFAFGFGMLRSDQAQLAFNASVRDQSQDQAQQALSLDPSLNLYQLQVTYLADGDQVQEIASYQHSLMLEPTWDTGWINLAALYERQGNTTQALDALQHAIAIDNRNGALLLWSRLAERTGAASQNEIVDAYARHLHGYPQLPLSSFWDQTELRKQVIEAYAQDLPPDLRYRVAVAHKLGEVASLVPSTPETAADWWVVGEYVLTGEGNAQKAETAFTEALASAN